MFKIDHLVINIDKKYQKDKNFIKLVKEAGFPYEPAWGKGTSGFKASNLWIGKEYFEMINILKRNGGGWKQEWVQLFNNGFRGPVCIMLDVENIDEVYKKLKEKKINVTKPEFLKFKWCFNLLTRTMPWQNCYVEAFEGIPLQIGFQQMKDKESREFMESYMVPNSIDNGISGIIEIIIEAPFTDSDFKIMGTVFEGGIIINKEYNVNLDGSRLRFKRSEEYKVDILTRCKEKMYLGKEIRIENIKVRNV